jgi:HK97 family phage prohead protease
VSEVRQIGFARTTGARFAVDAGKREISGLLVPYGVTANSGGEAWTFSQGSLTYGDVSRVKLWVNHDVAQAVGVARSLEDQPDGLYGTFYIAPTPEGDNALTMASAGVWDGFSIGVAPGGSFSRDENGVLHANPAGAPLMEVSLTPAPAFDDARVHSVAASAATTRKEPTMGDENTTTTGTTTAAPTMAAGDPITGDISGTVTITPPASTDSSSDSGSDSGASSGGDLAAAVAAALPAALAQFGVTPGSRREAVPAASGVRAGVQVTEAAPYRFDGTRGAHEFSTDLAAALGLGALNPAPNGEAYTRVMTFMREQLNPARMAAQGGPRFVTTTDTAPVNPTQYRPDMFVGEQRFTTPLYDAFYKGGLSDATPFTFAKFNTASGLVGDHTEGTEPTAGSYSTAQGATITPAPVSGKVHITREVGDQGGNPQISGLLWDKIQYEYFKAMETKVAAILAAATPAEFTTSPLAAGANTVDTLATPIEQAIMRLNFIAGGNRFNYFAAHLDLYLALGGLKDADGRPYYPIINPTNANGQTSGGYPSLNVSGTKVDPVWSLGTTSDGTAHKSYLADTSALYFWASAPVKLDRLREEVEGWDLGVWGYQAGVLADASGLLKVTYDPTGE